MNGIHDLGGMDGFGPVMVEEEEPSFHEPWERRQLALGIAGFSLLQNGSLFRHTIERMDPAHYLASSYYEHWLTGIATALVELGHATREDLEELAPDFPLSRPATATQPPVGPSSTEPRYKVGDAVRVKHWFWPGHTRCPRYVQGKRGTVARIDVVASVPDVEAHSSDRQFTPTYSVRFDSNELWGDGAEKATIHVDLWEPYLEAL